MTIILWDSTFWHGVTRYMATSVAEEHVPYIFTDTYQKTQTVVFLVARTHSRTYQDICMGRNWKLRWFKAKHSDISSCYSSMAGRSYVTQRFYFKSYSWSSSFAWFYSWIWGFSRVILSFYYILFLLFPLSSKCSRYSDWPTEWMTLGPNPGSGKKFSSSPNIQYL